MIRLLTIVLLFLSAPAQAQTILAAKNAVGAFPLVSASGAATIVYDAADDSLVHIAAQLLQQDILSVTDKQPALQQNRGSKQLVIIGSIGKSRLIQQLIRAKKLDTKMLDSRWEAYQIQVVKNPAAGVEQALVIAGSDRRGTAYGVFELSKQIGVSPWAWWADVPVKKQSQLFIEASTIVRDEPKVKYRGIFINDEAPALSSWSKSTFGGFNHLFYQKVFELTLRLKGNYLWPAMWGSAFYDDDSLNRQTADNWGIVIGTSHHEPLMRAHDEWRRYGTGKWNYDSNAVRLQQFWKGGMQRAANEKIVSIGMRGDGDEPMTRETATALLERIVADQRKIISDVTGKPAAQTPQLWALYKEVQDYYDKGMRVPDDVTLLLCDDNWGNLRKLPKLNESKRSGGYGIYYHFDYVGGPRNYKWINTNNVARVWEQMHLAWEYNARQIWIVNVGDIKPMELPISFFLDYAWNPQAWNEDNLRDYYTQWAGQQFGAAYAKDVGDLLRRYSQLSARRKPELLDANTYNIVTGEADRVLKEWQTLREQAEKTASRLPALFNDAYFQLVLHPVKAYSNLQEMYWNVAQNRRNAADSIHSANDYAAAAKQLYLNDSLFSLQYHQIANGKWNGMMSQTHIGYTYWQQPTFNKMPEVVYVKEGSVSDTSMRSQRNISPLLQTMPTSIYTNLFYEDRGYVSIDAEHWTRAISTKDIRWKSIPDIGRDGSGITTFPVTVVTSLTPSSPHVEYEFYTSTTGKATTQLYFSPTLNFHNTEEGLQAAVSIDGEAPQIISLNKEDKTSSGGVWNGWVANNIIIKKSEHGLAKPGKHILKYWAISPGVVLQKLVVDLGGLQPSYLGPPETRYNTTNRKPKTNP